MQFLQSLLIECKNDKNNVCEKTIIRIMKEKQHISNFYIEWYNQYLSSYLYNTLVYGVSFWTAASIALWLARASLELLIRIITSRPGTIKDHIIYRMLSRVYSGYTGILVLLLIYYLYQKLFPQKQKDESFAFQLFGFTVEIRSLRSETDADCSLSNLVEIDMFATDKRRLRTRSQDDLVNGSKGGVVKTPNRRNSGTDFDMNDVYSADLEEVEFSQDMVKEELEPAPRADIEVEFSMDQGYDIPGESRPRVQKKNESNIEHFEVTTTQQRKLRKYSNRHNNKSNNGQDSDDIYDDEEIDEERLVPQTGIDSDATNQKSS